MQAQVNLSHAPLAALSSPGYRRERTYVCDYSYMNVHQRYTAGRVILVRNLLVPSFSYCVLILSTVVLNHVSNIVNRFLPAALYLVIILKRLSFVMMLVDRLLLLIVFFDEMIALY